MLFYLLLRNTSFCEITMYFKHEKDVVNCNDTECKKRIDIKLIGKDFQVCLVVHRICVLGMSYLALSSIGFERR